MGRELNERQRKFVDEYIKSNNATTAAKRAGYSQSSATSCGYKLLQNEDIKREIARLAEKVARKSDAARILSIVEIQEELSRIALDDDRKDQDRLRALELLGKAKGLFVERSEVTTVETPEAIKGMTMEQLRDLVSATKPS